MGKKKALVSALEDLLNRVSDSDSNLGAVESAIASLEEMFLPEPERKYQGGVAA